MGHFIGLEKARLVADVFKYDKTRFGPYVEFMAEIMRSSDTLGAMEREAIALHVSAINRCHYCVGSHRAALLAMGVSESDVTDIENGYHPDAKLAALLTFAARLTNTPSMVTETDINAARSVGATDQDIEDSIGVTVKWSQKTGQLAKVYPKPLKGYENGEAPELYRSI